MEFYKMQGCGNDLCVMVYEVGIDYCALSITLCVRRFGVGAAGIIVVKKAPLEVLYFHCDGSRIGMSGNGIRCFARYVYEKQLVDKMQFECLTQAGNRKISITSLSPFLCKVDMGQPAFHNQMIYVSDDITSFGRLFTIGEYHLTIYSFFMGTIHTVIFVDSLESDLLQLAAEISHHRLFKKQTDVNFVHIIDESHIEMKTYEHNSGWTLASGTGACASAITCYKLSLTKAKVEVLLPKGMLKIEVGKKENVFMEGPAALTYIGTLKEVVKC